MIHIQLPQAEVARLEHLFRSIDERKLRDRLQIILLAHRARPHQDIVERFGNVPRNPLSPCRPGQRS
jgi:uncharacterized protein (DUF924 family)